MTRVHIAERNRTNAQKSTGPRTAAGKKAVSQNARRHGATSKPDPASVATWLRVILDTPDLAPDAFLKEDEMTQRALALAEAEARVAAAEAALAELEDAKAGSPELTSMLDDLAGLVKEGRPLDMTKSDFMLSKQLSKMLMRSNRDETQPGGSGHRLRKRYLREARSRRRKAFQRWLDYLSTSHGRSSSGSIYRNKARIHV